MSQSQRITIPGRDDLKDISATPGGTIWATTPGGTRIAYNRDALLFMRNSPHSKTPPPGMHAIPGITVGVAAKPEYNGKPKPTPAARPGTDDTIFDMDS